MTAANEPIPITTVDTFRATWPIEDLDRTQADLVREAERDVPDILFNVKARIVGELKWRVTTAWEAGHPYGDPDALVLLLDAPAIPWEDATRPPVGRPRRVAA